MDGAVCKAMMLRIFQLIMGSGRLVLSNEPTREAAMATFGKKLAIWFCRNVTAVEFRNGAVVEARSVH
jgi:hypothetical protein